MAGVGIAAGAGLAAVFAGSVKKSAEFGMLSLKFGDTAENLSALAYAAGQMSLESEELFIGFKKLPAAIDEAINGSEEFAGIFATLNLDPVKMQGQSMTDNLLEFADALNATGMNDNSRGPLLSKVFGKGGAQFNEFLASGSKGIREMMTEAAEVGAVVTSEQAKQAKQIEDAFTKAWKSVKNAILSVGDALLPQADNIDRIVNGVTQVTMTVRQWVAANREIVVGTVLAVGGLTAMGIGLAVLGPAIKALASSWAILTGAIAVGKAAIAATMAIISAPILALPAALAAAGAAWLAFTDSGQKSVGAVGGMFAETWQTARDGWAAIVAKVSSGDLAGAAAIGAAAFQVEWVRFTNFLDATWAAVVENIQTSLRKLADEFEDFFDIEKDIADLMGNAVLEQQKGGAFLKQIVGPSPTDIRNMRLQAAKDRLAELMRPQPGGGGIAELAANNPIVNQIRSIGASSQSLGSLGGSANVGQFGGGISLTKQIADNTKEQVIQFGNLANWLKMNHDINNDGLFVVPGG